MDGHVRGLIEERRQAAKGLLMAARDKLDRLVQALLQEETIGQERLAQILGPRPMAAIAEETVHAV